MAEKKAKKKDAAAAADPKATLAETIAARKAVLAKHRDKPGSDEKRRLAQKRLKRAQRALGRVVATEKRKAAAAAKAKTE